MTTDLSAHFGAGAYSFGQEAGQTANLMDTGHEAILYVMKPSVNQFQDVHLRSFTYQFDQNFLGKMNEYADMTKRNIAHSGSIVSDLMNGTNMSNHLLPSQTPTMMLRTSVLSDRYRFVLVLSEKGSGIVGLNTLAHTNPSSMVRRIYTGYFEDEPYSYRGYGEPVLNENAFMVISHKTIVGSHVEHGPFGARTHVSSKASEEIIHPALSKNLTVIKSPDTSIHLTTPENCMNAIDISSDGTAISIPGVHSDITNDNGAHVLNDILEQPKQHVSHVMRGIVSMQEDTVTRSRLPVNHTLAAFEDEFIGDSAQRRRLGQYMGIKRSNMMSPMDLDVNDRISGHQIDRMVNGQLKVQPMNNIRPMYHETADQAELSMTNMYASLLAHVIPPVLSMAGLNQMTFDYQVKQVNGIPHPNFLTHQAKPNFVVSEHDLVSMAKAVEIELRNSVLATIFDAVGDFFVGVDSSTLGMTRVRLNLAGMGVRSMAEFEMPSCLGGIITPLLGDASIMTHNTSELEGLYAITSGGRDIGDHISDDDRRVLSGVNGYPYGDPGDSTMGYDRFDEGNRRLF